MEPGDPGDIGDMADWARAEEEYWAGEIGRLAEAHFTERTAPALLPVETLRSLPLAAARRLLRHAMERVRGDLRGIDFQHIGAAIEMGAGGRWAWALPGAGTRYLPLIRLAADPNSGNEYPGKSELPG